MEVEVRTVLVINCMLASIRGDSGEIKGQCGEQSPAGPYNRHPSTPATECRTRAHTRVAAREGGADFLQSMSFTMRVAVAFDLGLSASRTVRLKPEAYKLAYSWARLLHCHSTSFGTFLKRSLPR